jgi:hypothetical protein
MDQTLNIVWGVGFAVSFVASNVLCFFIKSYIVNQPQGNQSLFVLMLRDLCTCIQVWAYLAAVFSIAQSFSPFWHEMGDKFVALVGSGQQVYVIFY